MHLPLLTSLLKRRPAPISPPWHKVRHEILPPLGLPSAYLDSEVKNTQHQALLAEDSVRAAIASDTLPIPHPGNREGYYGDRHLDYWLSGQLDFRRVCQALCRTPAADEKVYEFGGSTGRVARHFANAVPGLTYYLSDINIDNIDWLHRHARGRILAWKNGIEPVLPLPQDSMDMVMAFSVFTHIDDLELAWLLALRNVTKPGGLLYLTIHDETTWELLKDDKRQWLRDSLFGQDRHYPSLLANKADMPGERFAVYYNDADVYNCNVFVTTEYIRRVWGAFFKEVTFIPRGHAHQTVVLLKK